MAFRVTVIFTDFVLLSACGGANDAAQDTGTVDETTATQSDTGTAALPDTGTAALPDTGTAALPDTETAALPDTGTGDSAVEPQPLGAGEGWTLLFRDEFDGTRLDLDKWRPNWFGADDTAVTVPINDAEASCYDPTQIAVAGGVLALTAAVADRDDCRLKDNSRAEYASGMIMSDDRYNFSLGFCEARIFLPPGAGAPKGWAAFWINGEEWPEDGEIDVMETLGGGEATRWTYHFDADTGPGVSHEQLTAPTQNLVAESGWHVFGVDWQEERLIFYYEGVDVGSVESSELGGGATLPTSPHYFILNLGLNGAYPITVPITMKVDYVRHWQR